MSPDSHIYLLWILATIILGWTLPRNQLPVLLFATGALYLFVYSPLSLLVLLLLTFLTGWVVIHQQTNKAIYFLIFLTALSFILYRLSVPPVKNVSEVMFIGLAFYVLRIIHILMDKYTNRLSNINWWELIAYLWFLPTLQVGPIHRFQAFQRDLNRRRWDSQLFAEGLRRIMFGYAKIIIIAKYIIAYKITSLVSVMDLNSWWYHYLDTLLYGANLYFMFAGFSDIAIGFALTLGFKIMENFNFPFMAVNILDFWRRWHISLSSWCRDYVYTPVYSISRNQAIAAIATMLVLGLWHEFSWRYLIWGFWHGTGIAVCQKWQKTVWAEQLSNKSYQYIWRFLSVFITFNFVIAGFVITSADNFSDILLRWQVLLRGVF